ncbi:MAG: carboxypeptidase regulatory-like domain-containing protein [Elusimicrobia bacterium]|nr:carboxypeptidase regulatory-like domain-containing protein [Elusimicrobiota bacterium]
MTENKTERFFIKQFATAFALAVAWSGLSFAVDLTVAVKNGSGGNLAGVEVYAIEFSSNGIGPNTKVLKTKIDGTTTFLALNNGPSYDVGASSQAYFPTLTEQIWGPHFRLDTTTSPAAAQTTITLDQDAGREVAWFKINLTAAAQLGCFNFEREDSREPLGLTIAQVDGAGSGVANFHNVPADATVTTYKASGFSNGVSCSSSTTQAVANGGEYTLALDFSDADRCLPPNRNTAQVSGSGGGSNTTGQTSSDVSIDGVVQSTDTAPNTRYVPWAGIRLKQRGLQQGATTFWDVGWANSDQQGRFQFYGLQSGNTYYLDVNAGCTYGPNPVCFEGFASTAATQLASPNYTPTHNDIGLYTGATIIKQVKLLRAAGGDGQIRVGVQDSKGRAIPNAWINIWQDGSQWHADPAVTACDGSNFHQNGVDVSSGGLGNFNVQATTGYTLITGMRPGNYSVQVWTQFSNAGVQYNAGADGIWSWDWDGHRGCQGNPPGKADDLRVHVGTSNIITDGGGTVRTNALGDNLFVFNGSGTYVAVSSITIVVPISTASAAAVIRGKLKFPGVANLQGSPIVLTAQKQCTSDSGNDCWRGGGYDVIGDDDTQNADNTYDYAINVSSTGRFWLQINSNYWGVVREGGGSDQIDLTNSTTAVKNFTFAKAGRAVGKLKKPAGGGVFLPGDTGDGYVSANINASPVQDHGGWGWTQVANDGSFVLGGLLPGSYKLGAQTWGGNSNYTNPDQRPIVTIVGDADSYQDVQFVDSEYVRFQANTAGLPSLNQVLSEWGEAEGEHFRGLRLPAGTLMDAARAAIILQDDSDDWENRIVQKSTTDTNSYPCQSGLKPDNKWCPLNIPTGSSHDFYFVRFGDAYGWCDHPPCNPNDPVGGTQFYFTILHSSKNVPVTAAAEHSQEVFRNEGNRVSTFSAIALDLTPPSLAAGHALVGKISGNCSGAPCNIIRQGDFEQFGGDFNKFVKFIPVVTIKDENDKVLGAGMVTPIPAELVPRGMDFERLVRTGDWNGYSAMISTAFPSGWWYEIKGLPANKKVFAAVTTPNYPSLAFEASLGVDGSTTTKNLDLDSFGSGAGIAGTVTPSTATAIVSLKAKGSPAKSVTPNASGSYRFDGLAAGIYYVTVEAGGYLKQRKEVEVTAAGAAAGASFTTNFSLGNLPPGIVQGRVYDSLIPFSVLAQNAKVVALDATAHAANPQDPPVIFKVKTSSETDPSKPNYSIVGLTPGNTYKIFVFGGRGKKVISQSTAAVNGTVFPIDFLLKAKALSEHEVFVKPDGSNFRFFAILPTSDYKIKSAGIDQAPYDGVGVASFTFSAVPGSDTVYSYTASASSFTSTLTYVLRVVGDYRGKVANKEVSFGVRVPFASRRPIDSIALLGDDDDEDEDGVQDNEMTIEPYGTENDVQDNTSVVFTAGSSIIADSDTLNTNTVPASAITAKSSDSLTGTQIDSTLVGNAYQIDVSSIQFTGTPIRLCASYDREKVGGNLSGLRFRLYDAVAGVWKSQTTGVNIDPDRAVVCAKIDPLTSQAFNLQTTPAYSGLALPQYGSMAAAVQGGQFVYNPLTHGSGSAQVGVGIAAAGGVASGGKYNQYNYPNPFNLKNKTVTLRTGTSGVGSTIRGTYIVVSPTGSGSVNATIKIYNLAGDLIRKFTDTAAAGQYNYFHWDGKNDSGNDVASGVYFASIDAPGADKKKPVKMVLVK